MGAWQQKPIHLGDKMNILAKLTSYRTKIIVGLAVIAIVSAGAYSIDKIAYNRGLNEAAVEITAFKAKVKDLNSRLTLAQSKVTTEVVTEYLTDTVVRERIVYRNRDVIIDRVPEQYTLSQGWVDAHDASARGIEIEAEIAANSFASGYTDREALEQINANYAICQANLAQLTALQSWVTQIQETTNATNPSN